MTNGKYALLTGPIGQSGQYLRRGSLLSRPSQAVIGRDKDCISITQRIAKIVESWEQMLGNSLPLPGCLAGDTSRDLYRLGHRNADWFCRNGEALSGTLLRNAARVAFGDNQRQTRDNNVSGAEQGLRLCEEVRIHHLAYGSTAYVFGRLGKTI